MKKTMKACLLALLVETLLGALERKLVRKKKH